ncbi:hypothetical protein BDA99DRAFT_304496 [Phascolomyces articulosus]|uniref:Uncharacterized protein n=1 Tax=Phascolomyces articulosus TaxID=60185 RepID=A0AAD5K740_9FUNG|nr:hypothetical protein BDA99DRAFT_304496 [Phascolomyces articulosus]
MYVICVYIKYVNKSVWAVCVFISMCGVPHFNSPSILDSCLFSFSSFFFFFLHTPSQQQYQ